MYPFSTLWKHEKTLRFSDVFTGQRKGTLLTNGLIPLELMAAVVLNIILFAKIVNNWKSLTIFEKSSILNVQLGSEYESDVR